jgi:hypothetical protein
MQPYGKTKGLSDHKIIFGVLIYILGREGVAGRGER